MANQRSAGRPRSFDEAAVLDRAVDTFWSTGAVDTTTRVLESSLGLTQSSIYNAFGSKDELLHRSIDRYLDLVETGLLTPLDSPDASPTNLIEFIDQLVEWISDPIHPGCLLLNVLGETADRDDRVVERAFAYRQRLRGAFKNALQTTGHNVRGRTELVLASVLGLNIAARGKANAQELGSMADALKMMISDWAAADG
ncbi:MAG: TetR/AcrR family transcriptional regulator [Acidimicrobiales bacterium]